MDRIRALIDADRNNFLSAFFFDKNAEQKTLNVERWHVAR